MMKRIGLTVAIYALLQSVSPAHVTLPWPGPGSLSAPPGGSCPTANNELDYSNNCNLVYGIMVFR